MESSWEGKLKGEFEKEPEVISAFESSMIDIELLGSRKWAKHSTVVLATFQFRTRPSMKFVQEGYQRGPSHVGRMIMHLRGYVWDDKKIESYIRMKEAEDFELLRAVSGAVASAMEALGDELKKYLEEAKKVAVKEKQEENKETAKESLFRKMFRDFLPEKRPGDEKNKEHKRTFADEQAEKEDEDKAKKDLEDRLFLCFKNFKKGHGMVMW